MKAARGLGLVEILIGIVCFIIAAIPLVGLFSMNMENARVLHGKAIALSAARQALQQVVLVSPTLLPEGTFAIPATIGSFTFGVPPKRHVLALSEVPLAFARTLVITAMGTDTAHVLIRIQSANTPRASVELARTVAEFAGGR